jgi:hypothetical protein
LVGYWYTASENYDICWTMPHCVLSLRLIGKLNHFFDSFMPLFSILLFFSFQYRTIHG